MRNAIAPLLQLETYRIGFPPGLLRHIAVALGYVLSVRVSSALTLQDTLIAPLWPPNSLLLAAFLLTPKREWPLLLGAVFPAHVFVQVSSGVPVLTSVGWYMSNCAEALAAAHCISLFSSKDKILNTLRGALVFVAFGVVLIPFLASFLDSAVVVGTGLGRGYWDIWNERLFSNMASNAVFTPLFIAVPRLLRNFSEVKLRPLELVTLGSTGLLLVYVIFHHPISGGEPLTLFLLLPLLAWTAARFGSAGLSTIVALLVLVTIWETNGGDGPFVGRVYTLQIFFVVLTAPMFCLGAVIEELRGARLTLQTSRHFSDLVADIASQFINIDWEAIDERVDRGLRELVAFLTVDAVGVYEVMPTDESLLRYSVRSEGANRPPASIDLRSRPDLLADLEAGESIYISGFESNVAGHNQKSLDPSEARTLLVVPVIGDRTLRGVLTVACKTRRQFAEEEIALLRVLGEVIFDAIQRRSSMRTLAESERRFREIANTTPMLIWQSDPWGLYTYVSTAWIEFTGLPRQEHDAEGWKRLIHPDDLERFHGLTGDAWRQQVRYELEYRVRRQDGEVRWVVDRGVPRYASDQTFLGYVGSLFDVTDLKRAEELLSDFTGKLILAQEEERRRIARELHDDVGQRIALVIIELENFRERRLFTETAAQKLVDQAEEIASSIRAISHNLHSARLEVLPLNSALNALCREFSTGQTKFRVFFHEEGLLPDLTHEWKLCFYRVTQEALQNVVKHSNATEVVVELRSFPSLVSISITDNGQGFTLAERSFMGLGLRSMRERVKAVGGLLTIKSVPVNGTSIIATIPLNEASLPQLKYGT